MDAVVQRISCERKKERKWGREESKARVRVVGTKPANICKCIPHLYISVEVRPQVWT
jgi:hypothetical protein